MKNKTALFALAVIVALTAAGTAWVYPRLPATLVTHWGVHGAPNGTMGRAWGAWLPVGLMVFIAALLWTVPYIDPRRQNYKAFRPLYNLFVVGMAIFMAYVQALSLAWNLGYRFSIARGLSPALGLLFIGLAALLRAARPNWFVGIRTPWTLSSPTVWHKTHQWGARAFFLAGVATLAGAVWEPALWLGVGFAVVSAVGLVAYSALAYEREQHSPTPPQND